MSPRQPTRKPWALNDLRRGRALALSHSVDHSTCQVYSSALNSWLAFANMHHFPIEPTINMLSYFIVYMSSHISPRSVKSYLSGLVQQLEPDFPSIREIWSSRLISKVMRGCLKIIQSKSKGRNLYPFTMFPLSPIVFSFPLHMTIYCSQHCLLLVSMRCFALAS